MPNPPHHRPVFLIFLAALLLPPAVGFSNFGPPSRTDEPSKSMCVGTPNSGALVVPTTRSSATICHATRFNGIKLPSFPTKTNNEPPVTVEPEVSEKVALGNFKSVLDRVNQSVAQVVMRGSKEKEEVVATPPKPKSPVELLASTFQRGAASAAARSAPTQTPPPAKDATPVFLKRMKSAFVATSSEDTVVTNKKNSFETPVGKLFKKPVMKAAPAPTSPAEQLQKRVESVQGDLQQKVEMRKKRVMEMLNEIQEAIDESTTQLKTTVDDTVKSTEQVMNEVKKSIPQRLQGSTEAARAALQATGKAPENKVEETAATKSIAELQVGAKKLLGGEQLLQETPASSTTKKPLAAAAIWKDFSAEAMTKTGNFMQWAAKEAADVASQAVAASKEAATAVDDLREDQEQQKVAVMERQSTSASSTTIGIDEEVLAALMAAEAELKALNAPTTKGEPVIPTTTTTFAVAQDTTEDASFALEVEEALLAAEAALDDLNDRTSPKP